MERAPEEPSSGAKGVNMNRAVASMLVLGLLVLISSSGLEPLNQDGPSNGFDDVAGSATWTMAIRDLADQGYVHGRSPGKFEPGATVTQAEMSVLLLRAEYGPDYQPPPSNGEWWEGWVQQAEYEGLMAPTSNPSAPATRGEVATLMWLAMGSQP
jgi:hypothetical protein